MYANIRNARNLAFHPGSTANLKNRQNSTYMHHLILCKETLDIMGKQDAAQQMIESAKVLFPILSPVDEIPTTPDSSQTVDKSRIRLTQKDRIRPDPDPPHWLL